MKNQGLLKTLPECQFPSEFLVARLLGKKGGLFRNWELLIASSDALENMQNTPFYPYLKKYAAPGIWRFLRNEHLWIYSRMNPHLRKTFSPYFLCYEFSTLIVCLRYLSNMKKIEPVIQELQNSLLQKNIQKILTSSLDFAGMLHALEQHLCSYSDYFKGLSDCYEKKGLAALEVFIRNSFFISFFSQKQPSLLNSFFKDLVDMHNCLYLAKNIRWHIETEAKIIDGGTIPPERLLRAHFRKDLVPVLHFLRLKNPEEAASAVHKLETALLCNITMKLKRSSVQRTIIGDILFCLWEQYRYTRNISMILNTILLDDEPVRESIVA